MGSRWGIGDPSVPAVTGLGLRPGDLTAPRALGIAILPALRGGRRGARLEVRLYRFDDPHRERGCRLVAVGGVAVVRVGGRTRPPYGPTTSYRWGRRWRQAEAAAGRKPMNEVKVRTTLRNAALAAAIYVNGPCVVEHPSVPHGLLGPVRLLS